MEKITKEELQEKLFGAQLSDDELEKVSGGYITSTQCYENCRNTYSPDSRLVSLCKAQCPTWLDDLKNNGQFPG